MFKTYEYKFEFRKFMKSSESEILLNFDTISIEELWQKIKTTP